MMPHLTHRRLTMSIQIQETINTKISQDEQILAVGGQLQLNQNWRMLEFPIQGPIDFDGDDPDLLQIALETIWKLAVYT
ncbi:MAG: hypothetical protein EZS28_013196 [Streblomastix strix]|uniref:Uncharacterized protein n=1 Tax=Streblomastix strix TaxID=222440 RepID=A0A5J4W8N2_9EUKA|nr:MAG: hypothetical protein EZS28_013196 [Streblomastix strix]